MGTPIDWTLADSSRSPVAGSTIDAGMVQVVSNAGAPTVNDDVDAGYFVGYKWKDTVSGSWYQCDDASAGDAVWTPTGNAYGNDIINGQFRVAQAGTSFPATSGYDLDGWLHSIVGSTAVVTVSSAVGSSTGKQARLVSTTTGDPAVAAGDHAVQQTRIEGYDAVKYLGNTFTIGFRVRSNIAGIHCVGLYDGTSSYIVEYAIDAVNTWEYKTVTIVGGLQAVASSINAWGLIINFTNMCGTTTQTTAGAWNAGTFFGTSNQVNDLGTAGSQFYLEDVTINLGTSVAPDTATYEQDLARCQRYFLKYSGDLYQQLANGSQRSSAIYYVLDLPVIMRTLPTVSYADLKHWLSTGTFTAVSHLVYYAQTQNLQTLSLYSTQNISTDGHGVQLGIGVGATGHLTLAARL